MAKTAQIGRIAIGAGAPLALIAGPCVLESRDHALRHANALADVCRKLDIPYVFKCSFDKANRTSMHSYRGPGIDDGLQWLADIKQQVGVPVLTNVHDTSQCRVAGEVVDVLQIPAFLCRQTDLLVAAAQTGRSVNIKKGQFVAPEQMQHAVTKVRESGNDNVALTERGTTFGHGALVVDFTGIPAMQGFAPVLFDATHSVQRPSGGATTGGDRSLVAPLARAAVAFGVDGLFMEVHEDPDNAPSDGPNMLPLAEIRPLLESLLRISEKS